jgi:hypothetical protein
MPRFVARACYIVVSRPPYKRWLEVGLPAVIATCTRIDPGLADVKGWKFGSHDDI